jgi:peptidoglycan/LPS O-acetylase OafA/YrhL
VQGRDSRATIPSHPSRGRQIVRFVRHFGEMLLAMVLGMVALYGVNGLILVPLGFTYLANASVEVSTLTMVAAMTIPMVAWMRIRKHSWRLNAEMAASMIVPTLVLLPICELGLLPRMSLMMGAHVLMIPAMLGVMLYRWRDYTCH